MKTGGSMKHLIEPEDLSLELMEELVDKGLEIYKNPMKYSKACESKILASLFFEPSTRTKFSFDAAMHRLGGQVIGFSDANTSSTQKGESLADTIRVMSYYADIIVLRHPKEGAPKLASEYSDVPIINGGDGGHQHPTQTLTDLTTIKHYKGDIKGHSVAFCGDLRYGRTVHSLIRTLARFGTKEFYLISPEELRLPENVKRQLSEKYNATWHELTEMEPIMNKIDILYMTRIQKERFFNEADYLKLKNTFRLDASKMENAKKDMMVMHPLPRVNEIDYDVDNHPQSVYFQQAKFGVYVRMALIMKLLEIGGDNA